MAAKGDKPKGPKARKPKGVKSSVRRTIPKPEGTKGTEGTATDGADCSGSLTFSAEGTEGTKAGEVVPAGAAGMEKAASPKPEPKKPKPETKAPKPKTKNPEPETKPEAAAPEAVAERLPGQNVCLACQRWSGEFCRVDWPVTDPAAVQWHCLYWLPNASGEEAGPEELAAEGADSLAPETVPEPEAAAESLPVCVRCVRWTGWACATGENPVNPAEQQPDCLYFVPNFDLEPEPAEPSGVAAPFDIKSAIDNADTPDKWKGETAKAPEQRKAASAKGDKGGKDTRRTRKKDEASGASTGEPDGEAGQGGNQGGSGGAGDDEEPARPSYVVREDWSRYGPPGVWFHGHKSGGKGDPEPLNLWLCSPLHVEAVTCTDDGRYFGRYLRFQDTFGRWRTWAMPMEMLRGSCEELRGELLAAGVDIDPQERGRLAAYLQWCKPKRRITAAIRTGWTRDGAAFVLPETVIGSEDVFYQAETMHQDGTAETGGDFATWKAEIAALCVGNPVLALSLCVALAGPLLAKVQRDSGGVHWIGDSSTGKTTALNVACSVWGSETFRRTWRATANGLEGAAAALNDTCLCLDEINEADPKEIGSIVYALGNGTGKTRANRVGSARHVFRWRLTLLSTGERTLAAQMAEGGKQPKAGQLVRLLNVPARRASGVFDCLHHFPEARALADYIKTQCGRHYGHAGPAFIEALLKDGRDFGAALADVEALEHFKASNSQEGRGAARFALYGLAGELAAEWGILPWPQGQALIAAAECYRLWREARGGGATEDRQILQAVADFISRHGDSRFSRKATGEEEQREPVVMQRAGWFLDVEDAGRVYLFESEALREATKGHDFKRALDALDAAGWIQDRDRSAEGKRSKRTAIGERKRWLYWILPGDLGE